MINLLLCAPLVLARVQYEGGGDWYNDPEVLPNLARELQNRVGLDVLTDQHVVKLTDPDLSEYPFLYLTGHGQVRFTKQEAAALRRYLISGGFLYADDDYGMDESFRQAIKQVFPDKELKEVSFSHPIYHMFYDLQGPPKIHEHRPGPPKAYGIFLNGRLAVFYTYNSNVSDGWTDRHDDPPDIREKAFQMGVNTVLYAISY